MRRFPHFLLAIFILSVAVAGCSRAPRPAGVLHIAQEGDPSVLDPARSYDTTSIPYTRLLYRGLVDFDFQSRVINAVAAKREVSPDGKTYTFWLRPDARFASGERVRPDDFRFAIERVLDPKTASDGTSFFTIIDGAKEWIADREGPRKLEHLRGIEVRGDDQIIFHLLQADNTFLNNLALPFAYAVQREYVAKLEAQHLDLSEHPNGCGPFKFVEWVHDGWLTLEKNPNYYDKSLPKSNRIEVRFGISPTLQSMLYEQGALDIQQISSAPPPDFLRMTQTLPWKNQVLSGPNFDVYYVAMNNEVAPFNDVRVRQALNYAINRQRIASYLTGRVQVAHGFLPPGMPGYNPDLKGYNTDPNKARALLKAAGYKDDPDAPIPFIYPTTYPWGDKAAQSIQADLRAVGMTISLQKMPYGELKAIAGRRGPNGGRLVMQGWSADYPDAANFLDPLSNGRSITAQSSLNRSFYSNPRVNKLLDGALIDQNPARRLAAYQEAEKIVVEQAPVVFLHHSQRYWMRQPWVEGFQLHPQWSSAYEFVSVAAH